MSIRRLFAGTIIAGSLLVGAGTVGQEVDALEDDIQNPPEPPNLGLDNPLGDNHTKGFIRTVTGAVRTVTRTVAEVPTTKPKEPKPLLQPDSRKTNIQPKSKPKYTEMTVEATAYVSFCDTGCIGITATGTNVKNNIYHPSGLPIIAVDPKVIPLGSIVEINGEKYIADDTGGAIKGKRIDILVAVRDTRPAFEFGRQKLKIKVFN